MMQMWFYWGYDCTFLFKTWTTKTDDKGLFIFACFLVLLFATTGQLLRFLKMKNIKEGKDSKIKIIILQSIIFVHDAFNMLLVMTYNWAVVIAVVLGYLLGYGFLNLEGEFKNPDQEHIADCC